MMADDVPAAAPASSPLVTFLGVAHGLLIGALGDGQALDADAQPGVVHHREHVAHALVRLADEVALGVVELERARRAGVDAELVLDRQALHAVARSEGAVVVHESLRDDEARDAARPGRGVGNTGQHEMDDVLGEVVLAVGDEDLLAADAPRPVAGRHRSGPDGAEVRAGVRLRQVHRPGPLAGHQSGQVALALLPRRRGRGGARSPLA